MQITPIYRVELINESLKHVDALKLAALRERQFGKISPYAYEGRIIKLNLIRHMLMLDKKYFIEESEKYGLERKGRTENGIKVEC